MKKLIKLDFIPINNDLGLLLIRVWFCISLFVKHGIEKVFHYSDMLTKFPDPIHVGPTVGLTFAMIADFVCTLLGYFTVIDPLISFYTDPLVSLETDPLVSQQIDPLLKTY